MNLTGLLRIAFRWKRAALVTFSLILAIGLLIAWRTPLSYQSQSILERKPPKITPVLSKQDDETFDVYRLTSESQRSVTLFKSRAMMEAWLDAIGIKPRTPLERERELAKLEHSLTVQPVSYTDLFIIKVRATSPEEAQRRVTLLVNTFTQWDLEHNRQEVIELNHLLQDRMQTLNRTLGNSWTRLKSQKAAQALSLSGSSAADQMQVQLTAEGKLYDMLTTELEETERQLQSDELSRTRRLAEPSLPGKPVFSHALRTVLALCLAILGAFACMFFLEWQDPMIRRMQDIAREIPSYPVLAIPPLQRSTDDHSGGYLGPLADAVAEHVRAKKSMVIQFISPSDGEDKTAVCHNLARVLENDFNICLIHQAPSFAVAKEPAVVPQERGQGIHALEVNTAEPLTKHLAPLKNLFNLFLLNTDNLKDMAPGSNLAQEADLICILMTAGQTSRYFLRALRHHLQRFPHQHMVFILNRYVDPLPPWLRSF